MRWFVFTFCSSCLFGSLLMAQNVPHQMFPCEYGARYVLAAEKYDSVTVVAVGGPGRVGYYNIRSEQWTWECLPIQDALSCVVVTDSKVIVGGTGGAVWYRLRNTPEWQNMSVPTNGRVSGMKVHPEGLIACTGSGAVVVFNESKQTWRVVYDDNERVWTGMDVLGDIVAVSGNNGSSLFSKDAGVTWYDGPVPIDTMHLTSALVVSDSLILMCGAPGRIVRSTNAGKSWDRVSQLIPETPYRTAEGQERTDTFRKLSMDSGGNIFVCGNLWQQRSQQQNFQIVARSSNSGESWDRSVLPEYLHHGQDSTLYFVNPAIGVVMIDKTNGVVFSGSLTNDDQTTVTHRTSDGGASWEFATVFEPIGGHFVNNDGKQVRYMDNWFGALPAVDGGFIILSSRYNLNEGKYESSQILRLQSNQSNVYIADTLASFDAPYIKMEEFGGTIFVYGLTNNYATSTNGGSSWNVRQVNFKEYPVSQISRIVPTKNGRIVVSFASAQFSFSSEWGFLAPLISDDGGNSWFLPTVERQDSVSLRLFGADVLEDGRVLLHTSSLPNSGAGDTLKLGWLNQDKTISYLPALPDSLRNRVRAFGYFLYYNDESPSLMLSTSEVVGGITRVYRNLVNLDPFTKQWSSTRMRWRYNGKEVELGNSNIRQITKLTNGNLVALADFNLICVSKDGGRNWEITSPYKNFLPNTSVGFFEQSDMLVLFGDKRTMYTVPLLTASSVSQKFGIATNSNFPESCTISGYRLNVFTYTGELVASVFGRETISKQVVRGLGLRFGVYLYSLVTPCENTSGIWHYSEMW